MTLDPHATYRSLVGSGPSPRLTWLGPDGERLELSGRVVATWAAKIANLLVEEVDAEPGTRVLLDLPPHWRTLAWGLGTWLTGACVVLPEPGAEAGELPDGGADVVVTTDPERWTDAGADVVVAVALPSFALRWPGELPAGVLDGATDVAMYADALGPMPAWSADAVALLHAGGAVTFGDLTAADDQLAGLLLALAAGEAVTVEGAARA